MGKKCLLRTAICYSSSKWCDIQISCPQSAHFYGYPDECKNILTILSTALTIEYKIEHRRTARYLEVGQERIRQRTKALGKAALGGDWELVDHNGQTRSNKDWHGKWVLLYFGFTHCPDICPEELEKLVEVVDAIDEEKSAPNIYPLFVTVDPLRDTPKAMKEYCAEYSPKILGLTGNDEQLRGVTRAYRVYFSSGPKDDDNDYIVDHTIITYLINPRGEFVDYYGQTKTPIQMKSSILNHIYRFEAGTE
ncbi:hypothetical protein FSP39_019975 [Pinctada imbricata]|uniref:Thioredoxin domain-containing protein n=1 Tax=Pinctada imbricata TaxID=66713 RepID=A0AA88YHX5_PINIB|nr:hypothetical protein FSP39_019975 [Pinctada imbricata]